ncbi:MAG: SDR family oxidoreductase, partial [Alphaproteobacteria bacterium]
AATPLGYIGEADEAADAAVFLASSKANFITGQILAVDGGRSLIDTVTIPAH